MCIRDSDGVGRGGILAAARGEAAASAAAAGGAELQDAWSAVVASDPLEGDPREGLRLLQVRLARGAGSSEESIHETGQTFVTLLKGLRHGGRWREAQQVVEIMEGWLHRIGPGARAAVAPAPATVRRAHWPRQPRPCLLYTSPSPRDKRQSRMPSSA